MWLFTRFGFFSATCARKEGNRKGAPLDPKTIQVRARIRDHLVNLRGRFKSLGNCKIEESTETDYRFRVFVGRAVWAKVMAGLAEETMYDNFKNECSRTSGDPEYTSMLHRIWDDHYRLQIDRYGPGIYGPYPKKKGKGKRGNRRGVSGNDRMLWGSAPEVREVSPFREDDEVEITESVKIEDADVVILVTDQDTGYKIGIIRWAVCAMQGGETAYAEAVESEALALVAHPEFERASWGDVKDDWDGSPVV